MITFGLTTQTVRAIIRRELITTRHNRFVQVFACIVLAGSSVVAAVSVRPETVPYGMLLLYLYVVPLFGILIGASAAQEEREERPFLLTQPVPRPAYLLGKAGVLSGTLIAVLALTLIPAFAAGITAPAGALLGGLGVVLAVVSVSCGLTIGQYAATPARGLMMSLLAWFGAFGLYDMLALGLSGLSAFQQMPHLWVAVLLLNPIDAVRLAGLFGLEDVPFVLAGTTGWIESLIGWLPLWVGILAFVWTYGLLAFACRQLKQVDL